MKRWKCEKGATKNLENNFLSDSLHTKDFSLELSDDFSAEILETRKQWNNTFIVLKEEAVNQEYHSEFITIRIAQQEILGILQIEIR